MSAFGGKADVIQGVAECPLIAISGHSAARPKFKIGCTENPLENAFLRPSQAATHRRSVGLYGKQLRLLKNYFRGRTAQQWFVEPPCRAIKIQDQRILDSIIPPHRLDKSFSTISVHFRTPPNHVVNRHSAAVFSFDTGRVPDDIWPVAPGNKLQLSLVAQASRYPNRCVYRIGLLKEIKVKKQSCTYGGRKLDKILYNNILELDKLFSTIIYT